MSECAECGASGQMYIVPADRDLLCWTCFYRRLGGVGDVPEHDQAGLETGPSSSESTHNARESTPSEPCRRRAHRWTSPAGWLPSTTRPTKTC